MSKRKAPVVHLRPQAPCGPQMQDADDDEQSMEQYVHERVADLMVLVSNLFGTGSAEGGNAIVNSVIELIEETDVHVGEDLVPLRMLMEIREDAEKLALGEEPEPT